MLRRRSLRNWISKAIGQISQMRRTKRSKAGVILESLESRAMLAATSFNTGTLTIDFSAANEQVTVSNDGTNITVSSASGVTGTTSFSTSTVNRLVVTDSGNLSGQTLSLTGTSTTLSSGLDVTGIDSFVNFVSIDTVNANASVIVDAKIDLHQSLTATDGNIVLKANEQGTTSGTFIGVDAFGGSVTTTGTGAVTVLGRGGDSGSANFGVRVVLGATISGTTTSVTGYGGASAGVANYGVEVSGAGSTISSSGGNVVVIGQGGTGTSQNHGVRSVFSATISAGGSGSVNITATGGSGTTSTGLTVGSADSTTPGVKGKVTSNSGLITINATATDSASLGMQVSANGIVSTGINRDLSITTDSLSIASGGSIDIGAGTFTLANKTAGRVVALGTSSTASTTLGLSAAELNRVSASTLVMGSSTAGNFTVSAAISPNSLGILELVTGGQIVDGNATGSDLTVTKLGLTASSGIGVGNGLETTVNFLEATTSTGGIELKNSGGLTIGGVNSTLTGLRVTGASGGIDLQNTSGDVRIAIGGDLIKAPENVSVKTLSSGNIITANNQGFGFASYSGSVNSTGGTLTLDAAGDIDLGETGVGNANGDVQSLGSMTLTAGGHIFLDDQASAQTTGNGSTITITAGGNVSMLSTHSDGSLIGSQNTSGGLISIRTGAGGIVTLQGDTSNPGVLSGSGGILLAADDMSLLDDIRAIGGQVNLVPVTAGRAIDLGTDTTGTLGLTSAEINNVKVAVGLTIGASSSGTMTFSGAIAPLISTVSFITGGNVVSTTSSGNDITNSNFLQIVGSQIGTLANPIKMAASGLATNTSGSNGAQYIAEADSLLVTSLDLKAGTGTITLTSGTILTGTNNDILGNVVVGTGATLGGSGIVTGNVSGAGTVAPGSSPGKLTINGDLTPTGTVAFEVNPPATIAGTNYDQIVVGGTVDLSGATLTFTGTTGAVAAHSVAHSDSEQRIKCHCPGCGLRRRHHGYNQRE
jgi:hypothetical protein